jgi:1,4-dihydroxy-2-naphthoate octaprenyltransferase
MSTPASTMPPGPARPMSKAAAAFQATRPPYLPTSLIPGLAGAAVAVGVDGADWILLPLLALGILLIHACTDVTNETEDFANGVDTLDTIENSGALTGGHLTVEEGRRVYAGLGIAALAVGLLLSVLQSWWVLPYGLVGLLGGFLYTGGPRPFKYVGLGDPFIIPLMGPLLTQGAYTALTGDPFHAPAFWLGFFPGFLIVSVLQANNAADIEGDSAAGVRTLAVRVGHPLAERLVVASLVLTYLTPVLLVVFGLFGPWVLLPLLTLPLAAGAARAALTDLDPGLAPRIAQIHLVACTLLLVGVVLDRV